jgi:hypothetical protein
MHPRRRHASARSCISPPAAAMMGYVTPPLNKSDHDANLAGRGDDELTIEPDRRIVFAGADALVDAVDPPQVA